ncbi:MAG: SDR family oxidoreductase [Blastocatellia bacterium]|nr:SDR family oxidoreductase [Blastocatellia bacterium]
MKYDYSNRVIIVTGAAGNLGQAVVRAFKSEGAALALVDRAEGRLSEIFPDLAGTPDCFFAPPTDITDQAAVNALVEATYRHFGRIEILVNVAGGYRAGKPLHETPLSDWDLMLNLNARSVFLTCQAVIPHMLRQGSGKIINIASRAALGGAADNAAYSVSKTAVVRLTESMAAELKDAGINVNCVMPGIIDTPPNRAAMPSADFGKWVAPQAVADVILFLASEGAHAITGAAVPV